MPKRDGTGPMGMGPFTGRGLGYCADNTGEAGYTPGYGRGRGYRRFSCFGGYGGRGRFAYGNSFGFIPSIADEKEFLKDQLKFFENQLEQVKKRLVDLEEKD